MTKVSVVIPTRNRRPLLIETINSVLAQTYTNYELIISDNNSTDDTAIYVKKLSKIHPHIRYVKTSASLQMVASWNNGINYIKGKYFCLLMDDDLWEPTFLEKMVKILDTNNDVGIVATQPIPFYNKDVKKVYPKNHYRINKGDLKLDGYECISRFLRREWRVGLPSAVMTRSKYFKELGMFKEPGIDPEMWLRILQLSNFYYLDEPLVKWRIHNTGSYTSTEKNSRLKSSLTLLEVLKLVYSYVEDVDTHNFLQQALSSAVSIKRESIKNFQSLEFLSKLLQLKTLWRILRYEI